MVEKKKTSRYSPEFRERAVRLLDEHRSDYPSLSAACREIGGKLGCSGDSLHDWWKQARRDAGAQPEPIRASICAQCDRDLMEHIRRIWHGNRAVYGAPLSR